MDKLKVYLAQLKKHHFWILCGIVVIVAMVTSSLASREVKKKYEDNKRQINATIQNLNALRQGNPNTKWIDKTNEEQKKIDVQVFDAWLVFGKEKSRLKWPEKVAAIGDIPVEKDKEDPNHHENLRANYMNLVVKPELEEIFNIVSIRHPKNAPAAGAPAGPPVPGGQNRAQAIEWVGTVIWDQAKRDAIAERYKMTFTPTWTRVRVTQEDYWVYRAVLNIIKALNAGADDHLKATVKRIETLDLAQWAVAAAQSNPGLDLGGAGNAAPATNAGPGQEDFEPVVLPSSGDTPFSDKGLLDGRYVDAKNRPISYDQLINNPPFTEFNQLPIELKLVIDQRKIPDLLSQCANAGTGAEGSTEAARMPIEVRQVLIWGHDVDTRGQEEVGNLIGPRQERSPYDVVVELRGIVYIYNAPNKEKLGKGSAEKPAERLFGIPVLAPKAATTPPPTDPFATQQ